MDLCSGQRFVKKSRVESETDDWSSITGDVLLLIAEKIRSIDDYVRLCAVCRSWYLLATDFYNQTHKLNVHPYYFPSDHVIHKQVITLTNPASDSTLQLSSPDNAGEISVCWGSPFGWVITFDRNDLQFRLLNPFTRATIPLPSLPKSWEPCFRTNRFNAFLTANPESDPDNCLVIIFAGRGKLAFARPGGGRKKKMKKWSHIQWSNGYPRLHDVTCFQGNLHGIRCRAFMDGPVQLVLFQLNQRPHLIQTLHTISEPQNCTETHLVTINGQLCLCLGTPNSFQILKIDLGNGNLTQLHSLGGHCLYLGYSCSFSRETSFSVTKRALASNYVFNYKLPCEVWDVVHSRMVHIKSDHSPMRSYMGFWILPSINFRGLEAVL